MGLVGPRGYTCRSQVQQPSVAERRARAQPERQALPEPQDGREPAPREGPGETLRTQPQATRSRWQQDKRPCRPELDLGGYAP